MRGNLGPIYGNSGIAALRSHVGNCLFCMSVRTALLETLVNIRIPEATPTVCGVGESESPHSLSGYSALNFV